LPPGYSYACVPSNCHFVGNSNNCVLISGPAPPSAWEGDTFPLTVTIHYRLYLAGFPSIECANVIDSTTLTYYRIIVDANIGVEDVSGSRFDISQNKPNPFSQNTTIELTSPIHDTYTLVISDLLGKTISTRRISANRGKNKITISAKDFESGIYFYTLSNGKNSVTRRMITQNN
jgi:hypothetical protein